MFRKCAAVMAVAISCVVALASCERQVTAPSISGNADSLGVGKQPVRPTRLAGDPRQAIVLECFYALDPNYYGRSSKMIWNCSVSDWAYLATDRNAFTQMRKRYDTYCTRSDGSRYPCGGSSVQSSFFTPMQLDGMYAAPWAYALQNYTGVGSVGRGGQCRYFANLILYRCEAYWDNNRYLRSYQEYIDDYTSGRRYWTKPVTEAQVSDVIQTNYRNGHTAIVVQIMSRDSQGRVTSVDVIDSNYIGGNGNEIIGRHVISNSGSGLGDLDSYIALKLNYR